MKSLGEKLRDLRKSKKITLVELAKLTGVAQASLSRIETGIMTGTIESHRQIAEALGTSLAEIYEGLDHRLSEVAHIEPQQKDITVLTDNISIQVLTTNTSDKKIIPLLYTIGPGGETKADKLDRGVERFFWILDGEITVTIENKEFSLKQKHSIYFDASLPHTIKNTGASTARIFCATSPPKI